MAKSKKKNKGVIAIVTIFIILLILMLSGFLVANHYLNKINRIEDVIPIPPAQEDFETDENIDESLEEIDPDSVEWNAEHYAGNDDKLINILLVGQDRRPGQGRQRSDSMILCSFNPETNQLAMISFLRDLYVQIPGYSDNRLNAAYVFGGFPLLKSTLYQNFGVTIDGCIEVDFSGFKQCINAVGGVDIELTAAEAKIIGDGAHEGLSHLDGDHALMYARIRKLDSDFGRTSRQRNVLNAVFRKVKDCSVSELLDLVDTILPLVSTDMTNMEITSLAVKYAPSLATLSITTHSVPGNGTYTHARIRGMAVLVPNLYTIKKQIFEEYLPI